MSDQQAVIDFLAAPSTHGGAVVTRVDTHAAAVFLAGQRVLKIKRAVRFPFLDFSTLNKRKAACEAELAVNRPYAPAIYKRVVAITREADGRLTLGGTGEPVEWAVEMARFDETATLDHLAARGAIDDVLADKLGRAVAAAHAKAPHAAAFGFAAMLAEIVTQNDAELRETPALFPPDQVAALTQKTRAALERVQPLLTARERDGLVRRCHGDLHLGNIVLIDDAPVLFDAIEFDDRIATADVLYDLAFLLMDLWHRRLPALANLVMNRYLDAGEDEEGLALLPFFMAVRAAVRAHVTATQADIGDGDAAAASEARQYFRLAAGLLDPPPPRLIAIGGFSGSGKSTVAAELAPRVGAPPGARIVESDRIRKARLHPVKLLAAMITYQAGRGQRSKGEGWEPVTSVVDALDAAFYLAFGNVEPSNKRLVFGLDVSGSMFAGSVSGVPGLTPGVASAALALVSAATERDCELMAFSDKFIPLTISPRQRLDDVVKTMNQLPFGATDKWCATIDAQPEDGGNV